jgi:hypothetical protein
VRKASGKSPSRIGERTLRNVDQNVGAEAGQLLEKSFCFKAKSRTEFDQHSSRRMLQAIASACDLRIAVSVHVT